MKILFASNLNLGFTGYPTRDEQRLKTFNNILNIALKHDILVFGGNLLDITCCAQHTVEIIKHEIQQLIENAIPVIAFPGNRELTENNAIDPLFFNLGFTHIFTRDNIQAPYIYTKDNEKAHFYGLFNTNDQEDHISMQTPRPQDEEEHHIKIGLQHINDIDSSTTYTAFTDHNQLDLYLFGNSTDFKVSHKKNIVKHIFSGSLIAGSDRETGDRYAVSLTILNNKINGIDKYKINTASIQKITLDCDDYIADSQLAEAIKEQATPGTFTTITLQGTRSFKIPENFLDELKIQFRDLAVIDNTVLAIGLLIDQYFHESSLRGDFFRLLKEKIDNNNLPDDIDLKNFTNCINILSEHGIEALEEKLCDLSDA